MNLEQVAIPILRQVTKRPRLHPAMNRLFFPLNPFDPQRYVDPYPIYDTARRVGGHLFRHQRARAWVATGYAEAEAILRGPVSADRSGGMGVAPYSKMDPRLLDFFNKMMLASDPPNHTRLRKLVNRAFTPRAVAALEPQIEKITAELLEGLAIQASAGRFEVMSSYADRIPIYAIADMIGLPQGERERLKAISDVAAQFIDPITGFDPKEMGTQLLDFEAMMGDLITARERQPQDDLLSALVAAEEDGDRLSRDELVSMMLLLMVAGHETTSGLIGTSLVNLDRHRHAREQLLAEPDIAENMVEEMLRFDSAVQATDRLAIETFEVAGHRIEAGHGLIVLLGAANRDPRRYDRPDELLIDRPDPRPLSFGHGIHHCLGAALARLEARIAIPRFVETFPDYRVVEEQLEWKRSVTLRGPTHLTIQT